jgi:hypothetical protein
MRKRGTPILDAINKAQDTRRDIIRERSSNVKPLIQRNAPLINKSLTLESSHPFCPIYGRNLELEFKDTDDQPLGLKKGSIRACLTIWIVLQTCIMATWIMVSNTIPMVFKLEFFKWWLMIAGLVIASYYVMRTTMGNRMFF